MKIVTFNAGTGIIMNFSRNEALERQAAAAGVLHDACDGLHGDTSRVTRRSGGSAASAYTVDLLVRCVAELLVTTSVLLLLLLLLPLMFHVAKSLRHVFNPISQPPKPLPDASTARWQSTDGAEIVTLPLVAIAAFTQVMLVVSDVLVMVQAAVVMCMMQITMMRVLVFILLSCIRFYSP